MDKQTKSFLNKLLSVLIGFFGVLFTINAIYLIVRAINESLVLMDSSLYIWVMLAGALYMILLITGVILIRFGYYGFKGNKKSLDNGIIIMVVILLLALLANEQFKFLILPYL